MNKKSWIKSSPSEVFLTNKEQELYVLNLLQDLQVFPPKERNILIENHIYRLLKFYDVIIIFFQLFENLYAIIE